MPDRDGAPGGVARFTRGRAPSHGAQVGRSQGPPRVLRTHPAPPGAPSPRIAGDGKRDTGGPGTPTPRAVKRWLNWSQRAVVGFCASGRLTSPLPPTALGTLSP